VGPDLHNANMKVTFLKSVWNWHRLALINSRTCVRNGRKFHLLPSKSVGLGMIEWYSCSHSLGVSVIGSRGGFSLRLVLMEVQAKVLDWDSFRGGREKRGLPMGSSKGLRRSHLGVDSGWCSSWSSGVALRGSWVRGFMGSGLTGSSGAGVDIVGSSWGFRSLQ
jgi:hypothetical protein